MRNSGFWGPIPNSWEKVSLPRRDVYREKEDSVAKPTLLMQKSWLEAQQEDLERSASRGTPHLPGNSFLHFHSSGLYGIIRCQETFEQHNHSAGRRPCTQKVNSRESMRVSRKEWAESRETARAGEALWDQQRENQSHPYVGLRGERREGITAETRED